MDRLHGKGMRRTSAEAAAALRIAGAIVIALAVLLGPAEIGTGFVVEGEGAGGFEGVGGAHPGAGGPDPRAHAV